MSKTVPPHHCAGHRGEAETVSGPRSSSPAKPETTVRRLGDGDLRRKAIGVTAALSFNAGAVEALALECGAALRQGGEPKVAGDPQRRAGAPAAGRGRAARRRKRRR